jgi:4-hydroxybutyrate dehydrogenase
MPTSRHRYNFPTQIEYGPGAVRDLAGIVKGKGHKKGLLVTDKGVVQAGVAQTVQGHFERIGVPLAVFDDIKSNPIDANVYDGTKKYKESGADFILTLGGGSPMDVAKCIKCLATHDGPLEKYDDMIDGSQYIQNNMPDLYAVPTTAGTGSEVGRSGVITILSTNKKTIIFSPYFMPNIAVLDPEVTVSLPAKLTAATGVDAFVHNLEAYLTDSFHPLADGIAKEGMVRAFRNLPLAVQDGGNLAARGEMLMASAMGAIAFQKGLGLNHSIAHALGVYYDTHHGLANAAVLLGVMRYNLSNDGVKEKLALLGQLLGTNKDAHSLLALLKDWLASIGMPTDLKSFIIPVNQLQLLEEYALADPCCPSNPRKVQKGDVREILSELI